MLPSTPAWCSMLKIMCLATIQFFKVKARDNIDYVDVLDYT